MAVGEARAETTSAIATMTTVVPDNAALLDIAARCTACGEPPLSTVAASASLSAADVGSR